MISTCSDGYAIPFIKGHCGWDVLTLVPMQSVAVNTHLETALKIIDLPINGGLEVGYLGVGNQPDEILVKMVNSTTRTWIPMCGGMTQVIGKALVETFFAEIFSVDKNASSVHYNLITDAGKIPIIIQIEDQIATKVITIMDTYLAHLYDLGVERVRVREVDFLRVGKYAVINIEVLLKLFPGVDFTRRDTGEHLSIVNGLLKVYCEQQGISGVNGMLFDQRAEGPGHFRVFPRFYSEDMTAATIPWEFQCGTGTVAVGAALAYYELVDEPPIASEETIIFEWGSYKATPDPYGIRTSQLNYRVEDKQLVSANFSHSVVEIVAEGQLALPEYG